MKKKTNNKNKQTKQTLMIIIGAGSAGLFLSEKIAKEQNTQTDDSPKKQHSEKITIIEEHKKLGTPVQCTGILTDDIYKLIPEQDVKKFTLNTINRTKIYSPNNNVELKLKNNIIIDNVKFIEYLADKAEKQDVKILTNRRYIINSGTEINIKNLENQQIETLRTNYLIGCDGPQSNVAANNNLFGKRKFLLGMQARIKIKDLDKNLIDFYPHLGEYAWSVPENEEIARVGIALPLSDKQEHKGEINVNNKIFYDFLKKYPGTTLDTQAGLIPLHKPRTKIIRKTKNFNVSLVGDSALQIKNTTGGGIIPGMKAAEALSHGLNNYKKNTRNLNKELYLHYILNRAFKKYTEKDWDRLIEKVKREKIKEVIENNNRDNVGKLLLSLITKKGILTEGIRAASKLI